MPSEKAPREDTDAVTPVKQQERWEAADENVLPRASPSAAASAGVVPNATSAPFFSEVALECQEFPEVASATPTSAQYSYDDRGRPSKHDLPPGAPRPGAYGGAFNVEYSRCLSARLSRLGLQAMDSEYDRCRSARLSQRALQAQEGNEDVDLEGGPASPNASLDSKQGRLKFMAGLGLIVAVIAILLVIIIPIVLVAGGEEQDTDDSVGTSPPPTFSLEVDTTLIPGLSNATLEALKNTESHQYQAYVWMAQDPNLAMQPGWKRQQRFAMATFYYAFGGPKWNPTSWLSTYDSDECEWIKNNHACDEDGHVVWLDMTQQRGFKGSIPLELSLLTRLEVLDFSNNILVGSLEDLLGPDTNFPSLLHFGCSKCRLQGTIPSAFFRLSNLESFSLNENKLTGELPSQIGSFTSLSIVELEDNQLSDELPTSIGRLKRIRALKFRNNQVSFIPSQIGHLSHLEHLDLGGNALQQEIPVELGKLSALKWLTLDDNQLSGMVPSALGELSRLQTLYIDRNNLVGTIPEQINALTSLGGLRLNVNDLSGTISTLIGRMTKMSGLDLSINRLTGPIPSELGQLSLLLSLHMKSNALTGSIPSDLGRLALLNELTLMDNPFLGGDIPEAFCQADRPAMLKLHTDWCATQDECCAP